MLYTLGPSCLSFLSFSLLYTRQNWKYLRPRLWDIIRYNFFSFFAFVRMGGSRWLRYSAGIIWRTTFPFSSCMHSRTLSFPTWHPHVSSISHGKSLIYLRGWKGEQTAPFASESESSSSPELPLSLLLGLLLPFLLRIRNKGQQYK